MGLLGDNPVSAGSSYPGYYISERVRKRRHLSGVYQIRDQIKQDLISRHLHARTNRGFSRRRKGRGRRERKSGSLKGISATN